MLSIERAKRGLRRKPGQVRPSGRLELHPGEDPGARPRQRIPPPAQPHPGPRPASGQIRHPGVKVSFFEVDLTHAKSLRAIPGEAGVAEGLRQPARAVPQASGGYCGTRRAGCKLAVARPRRMPPGSRPAGIPTPETLENRPVVADARGPIQGETVLLWIGILWNGLLRERNAIDAELAELMQRPMTSGHLGEWIAAQVFDIRLEASAVAAGIDGRFRSGPLAGRTVNIKWYFKRESLLDTTECMALDYYLVLTGPPSAAVSSRGHRLAVVHRGGVPAFARCAALPCPAPCCPFKGSDHHPDDAWRAGSCAGLPALPDGRFASKIALPPAGRVLTSSQRSRSRCSDSLSPRGNTASRRALSCTSGDPVPHRPGSRGGLERCARTLRAKTPGQFRLALRRFSPRPPPPCGHRR